MANDAPIVRHLIAQLRKSKRYLLPVGGEVMRRELAASGVLPIPEFKLPAPQLTLEFQVSEAGFLTDPYRHFSQPTIIRMALVQYRLLKASAYLEAWCDPAQGGRSSEADRLGGGEPVPHSWRAKVQPWTGARGACAIRECSRTVEEHVGVRAASVLRVRLNSGCHCQDPKGVRAPHCR